MDCLAEYHARRVLSEHGPPPLTRPALAALCRRRGVRLLEDTGIASPALYVGPPRRMIVHRPAAPAWILAHELLHDYIVTAEPDILVNFRPAPEEELCNRFATLLCGPSPILPGTVRRSLRPRGTPLPRLEASPTPAAEINEDLRLIVELLRREARGEL
ncbi:MAG TPA: hypothetical protein VFU47_03865 [Armatimonadota bacterium]|nr:hypothetical protein [Armatimonadota bacterium]